MGQDQLGFSFTSWSVAHLVCEQARPRVGHEREFRQRLAFANSQKYGVEDSTAIIREGEWLHHVIPDAHVARRTHRSSSTIGQAASREAVSQCPGSRWYHCPLWKRLARFAEG